MVRVYCGVAEMLKDVCSPIRDVCEAKGTGRKVSVARKNVLRQGLAH